MMNEAEIRDKLALDLGILEKGLVLKNKEKYIPNNIGTKGFIDIYAEDENRNHVLIELKRSNATSREALHEIHKYVSGVISYLGCRKDEVRVFIVSIAWKELIVPFSKLMESTDINLKGFLLTINENEVMKSEEVKLIKLSLGRVVSPYQMVYCYYNKNNLKKGIRSIIDWGKSVYIEDYVLIELSVNDEQDKKRLNNRNLYIDHSEYMNLEDKEKIKNIPICKNIVYFAMRDLTLDEYKNIGNKLFSNDTLEEIVEYSSTYNDKELSYAYFDNLSLYGQREYSDQIEIGKPAKFQNILEMEGWKIEKINRFGSFQRNDLLEDDVIIEEILGYSGSTGQRLKKKYVKIDKKQNYNILLKEVDNCLINNKIWRNSLKIIFTEIEENYNNKFMDVSIFNPTTGLHTLYFSQIYKNGYLYLPNYFLRIYDEDGDYVLYFGCLSCSDYTKSFSDILTKYYESDIFNLLFPLNWGGYTEHDDIILKDLGLRYTSYKKINDIFYKFNDMDWIEIEPTNFILDFNKYTKNNIFLLNKIVSKIKKYNDGVMILVSNDHSASLKKYYKIESIRDTQINITTENCDLCKSSFLFEDHIVDGSVKGVPMWAFMCEECFMTFGNGLGWGQGQLYAKYKNDWYLAYGGSNLEDDQ